MAALPAAALDKQGGPRSDSEGPQYQGFNFSGAVMLGASLYNPTYGARPDNTGLALFRYAAHFDVDLLGPLLSIPIDLNMFTDRTRSGAELFAPTEFDVIAGVTSTQDLGPISMEEGVRVEHDRPVDQGTFTQTYVDARVRGIFAAGEHVSGWATLGCFLFNPTYAARPDNTGLAFLRYGLHAELSLFHDLFSIGLDAVMFTDRQVSFMMPSELDLTPELIFHWAPFEVHLAYERDMPLDRGGLTQQFVYVLAAWSFDVDTPAERAFTDRNSVHSP
ncbi:MAG: hypothetical protein IPJ65_00610 [Archangiaceae bacterium]|nr:hypothetical protein [Archangiaceae bacterium]